MESAGPVMTISGLEAVVAAGGSIDVVCARTGLGWGLRLDGKIQVTRIDGNAWVRISERALTRIIGSGRSSSSKKSDDQGEGEATKVESSDGDGVHDGTVAGRGQRMSELDAIQTASFHCDSQSSTLIDQG